MKFPEAFRRQCISPRQAYDYVRTSRCNVRNEIRSDDTSDKLLRCVHKILSGPLTTRAQTRNQLYKPAGISRPVILALAPPVRRLT